MTLTDLASHICTQCGMTDSDDVAAAQMFLQRRLEMIWNSALWRDSLLEATLTLNPNDTTTLADSYWISERSVLLLPAAIEKVIAARLNTNALEAASLESYYRTDTDWLDYQGTPYEFQILKPVVMEWAAAQMLSALDANAADIGANPALSFNYSLSPDGVTITNGTLSPSPGAAAMGSALQLLSFSKPSTTGNVSLNVVTAGADLVPNGTVFPQYNGAGALYVQVNGFTVGQQYQFTPGTYSDGSSILTKGAELNNPTPGDTVSGIFTATQTSYYICAPAQPSNPPSPDSGAAVTDVIAPVTLAAFATVAAAGNNAPMHQRIRLTEAPAVAINLRVLGKGKCPVLGPYDTVPITNAEPSLMAFARGDLLLRQRQFGKAALAQQEGAALLKELVETEAFQQAGEFRIQPDAGFGGDQFWMQTAPDSYHPL